VGFSYHLGCNTTYCYTMDKPQNRRLSSLRARAVRFNWPDMDYDFGYPNRVSSSMYRTADLLPL